MKKSLLKNFIFFVFIISFQTLLSIELGTEAQEEASYDIDNKFAHNNIVILTRSDGSQVYGKITSIDDQVYTVSYDEKDPKIVKYYKYYVDDNPKLDTKKEPITGSTLHVLPLSKLGKLTGRIIGELTSSADLSGT